MYSPSNSPSNYNVSILFGIKLLIDPVTIADADIFRIELIKELSNILFVSNDRFQLRNINIRGGALYVLIYILDANSSAIYKNNTMSSLTLLTLLGNTLTNTIENTYKILPNIDITYGTNGIRLFKDDTVSVSSISNISIKTSVLDQFINNKIPFALYTYVKNESIPSISNTSYKMYLTTSMTNDEYIPCSKDGMINFNPELTIGAIYNLNTVKKYIPKNLSPYKYIDFDSITYDSMTKRAVIVSTFYNLTSYANGYSVSYCQQDCHADNENGMCSQEKILIGQNDKSSKSGKYSDLHNLKNYMKIKEESDGTITPYFISLQPVERIYFITNKISTTYKPHDFKTIVQVPQYEDYLSYYETPVYNTSTQMYSDKKQIPITNLNLEYTTDEIENYNNTPSFSASETHAFKNSAYTDYAYSFYIEPITNQRIQELQR